MEQNKQVLSKEITPNRIDYIDAVKGIGILLVIIGHHLLDSENVIMWINSFHMPLFFIVSGYLSKKKQSQEQDLSNYTIKQANAVLYPYLSFSIINLLWYCLFHSLLGFAAEEPLLVVVTKTMTTYGYHALWFLPTIFFVSIISKRWDNRLFSICGQIALIIYSGLFSLLLNNIIPEQSLLWYIGIYVGRIIIGVTFWGIGKYLSILLTYLDNIGEWCLLVTSLLISLLFYQNLPNISISFSRIGNPLIFFPVACAGSVFVLLLCKKTALGRFSALHFLGRNSLAIMALHMDIPIQIAWVFIGATGLSSLLGLKIASSLAIFIEIIVLIFMVLSINRFFPYLLEPTKRIKNEKV
jgi:fucose 4-O-acetylase-like acetyltransferase